MKNPLLTLFVLLCSAVISRAALINIGSHTLGSGGRLVVGVAGSAIPLGSIIRIGTFPAGLPADLCNFAQVNAGFVPIGENPGDPADGTNGPGVITTMSGGGSGWAFTINDVDNTDTRFVPLSRLYIMVLDAPPSQMFNFSSMLLMSDPAWTIPNSGSRALLTSQIDQPSELFFGFFSGASQIQMPLYCPEPSAAVTALLAGLGTIARRRRSALQKR